MPCLPLRRLQIERVHIPRPKEGDSHSKFGFIHFRDRGAASRAVEDDHKPEMDGVALNVGPSWGRGGGRQEGKGWPGHWQCASRAGRTGIHLPGAHLERAWHGPTARGVCRAVGWVTQP